MALQRLQPTRKGELNFIIRIPQYVECLPRVEGILENP